MDRDKIINSYQNFVNQAKPEDVMAEQESTVSKVKNVSVLAGLMDNIVLAYGLVTDSVKGRYTGLSKGKVALMVGGLAYLALPVDLVPDVIPVVGWLDDAAVLTWVFSQCNEELKKYKRFKERNA